MNTAGFMEALEAIVVLEPRYDREAYLFLRDALDFTIKRLKKDQTGVDRHVSPAQLCDGIREYALREYGQMTPTVFEYWGITETLDFGKMVFTLVEAGIFGTTETDKLDDFADLYDFETVFVVPFLPESRRGRVSSSETMRTVDHSTPAS